MRHYPSSHSLLPAHLLPGRQGNFPCIVWGVLSSIRPRYHSIWRIHRSNHVQNRLICTSTLAWVRHECCWCRPALHIRWIIRQSGLDMLPNPFIRRYRYYIYCYIAIDLGAIAGIRRCRGYCNIFFRPFIRFSLGCYNGIDRFQWPGEQKPCLGWWFDCTSFYGRRRSVLLRQWRTYSLTTTRYQKGSYRLVRPSIAGRLASGSCGILPRVWLCLHREADWITQNSHDRIRACRRGT